MTTRIMTCDERLKDCKSDDRTIMGLTFHHKYLSSQNRFV